MTAEPHLFGLPGAEEMDTGISGAYEQWTYDYGADELPDLTVTVEEWTTKRPEVSPYDLSLAVENLVERVTDEGDENYVECWEEAAELPDVMAAFQAAADLLASKITYRMADNQIHTHVISHTPQGTPMVSTDNGPLWPLYQSLYQ